MALQITKGVQKSAIRGVIYGVEGIGKTTLGAQLPDTLILDIEDGSKQLDVARVRLDHATRVSEAIRDLVRDPQGFRTILIDTADWLERLVAENLLQRYAVKSIEDVAGGYGKGYTILREDFDRILTLTDGLIEQGIHVVFIAHSTVKKISPPDQTDGFDRYELKVSKQVAPLLKEWADLVLFCNFQIQMVEGTDGRIKATGGTDRVIHTTRTAAWDAKNRFGLRPELPMHIDSIRHIFDFEPAPVVPSKPATPPPAPEVKNQPAGILPKTSDLLISYLKNSTAAQAVIDTALEFEGAATIANLTEESAQRILADVIDAVEAEKKATSTKTPAAPATPAKPPAAASTPASSTSSNVKTPFPASVAAAVAQHEKAVNGYLTSKGWITAGQTWRDVSPENAEKIINKTAIMLSAAKTWAESKGAS